MVKGLKPDHSIFQHVLLPELSVWGKFSDTEQCSIKFSGLIIKQGFELGGI